MYSEDLKFKKKYLKYKQKYIKLKGGMFNYLFGPIKIIINKIIGEGSFGKVYELDKPKGFVIKILKCPKDYPNPSIFKNNTIIINNILSNHNIIPTVQYILNFTDFLDRKKYEIEKKEILNFELNQKLADRYCNCIL
jgi:hypothetical protein